MQLLAGGKFFTAVDPRRPRNLRLAATALAAGGILQGMTAAPRDLDALLAHVHWVRALALQLCADAHNAEDAAQDALAAAVRQPPRDAERTRGFLARTVRNALAMAGRADRRRRRREALVALPADAADVDAGELVARAELHRRLVEAVLRLPAPARELVLRHYFEGVDVATLAARGHTTADAVRGQLRRARERLRLELQGGGGQPARALAVLLAATRPSAAALWIMTMNKLLLAAVAMAAAVWLLWPAAAPTAPTLAAPATDLAAAAGSAASPADRSSVDQPATARTELALPAAALSLSLTGRLIGLAPNVPWTSSLSMRAKGRGSDGSHEHEAAVAVDDDGTFALQLPPWARQDESFELRLSARDPYYLPLDARLGSEVREGTPLELQVEPAGAVTGRVVDAEDHGVAAARVCAFQAAEDPRRGEIHCRCWVDTDAEGHYRLQVPIAARLTLLAVPMHEASLSGMRMQLQGGGISDDGRVRDDLLPRSVVVDSRWGQVTEAPLLRLPAPAFVTGSVLASDGSPIADVEVLWLVTSSDASLYDPDLGNLACWADGSAGRSARARTDANGRFRLPATPGHQGVCYPLDARGRPEPFVLLQTLTPPAEATFRLDGDVAILRVVSAGAPVPDVVVRTDHIGDRLTASGQHRRTNANGELRLLRSQRADQQLLLERPGSAALHATLPAAASPIAPFVVELPPLPTARVRLEFDAVRRVRQIELDWQRLDAEAVPLHQGRFRSDGDGPFQVDVPPGRYRLTVSAPERAERHDTFLLRRSHEVEVPPQGAELRLPIEHGGRIAITMTAANGAYADGLAEMTGAAGTARWSLDKHGRAQSPNVAAGEYRLRIQRSSRVVHEGTIVVEVCEVTEVRVRLP